MKRKIAALFAAVMAVWFMEIMRAIAQVPEYTVIDLGTLGGNTSSASGINNNGQVVGSSQIRSNLYTHAFLYSNGSMKDLGTLGESESYATGINNSGQVVGYSWARNQGKHALLYSSGSMQDLGTLGGDESTAFGINDSGQVVGGSWTRNNQYRAFLYSNGFMQDLGTLGGNYSYATGINNSGQVVGLSWIPGDPTAGDIRAFLYANGSMQNIGSLGGNWSYANGINDIGQVIGESWIRDKRGIASRHAFLYSKGSMQDLGTLGGDDSGATGINNSGQVVGSSWIRGNLYSHAFLYSDGSMQDLNDLIDPSSGLQLMGAQAINNVGQIVGSGINPSGQLHAFLLNPLSLGWRKTIETQPVQPTYSEPPKKKATKDSLVVVTHGWQPAFLPVDIEWVDTMTNVISKYLVNQGLTDWHVHAHKWVENARVKNPDNAIFNGKAEGVILGRNLVRQELGTVHLIAHSAGAGLIQLASETIKMLRPDITVHLTFLDPFVGLGNEERGNYGKGADWADSYFSRDTDTGGEFYQLTEGPLNHAYNVDVTWLDTNKTSIQMYASTPLGDISQTCYQTVTSHGWPYQFYTATVPPNTLLGSQGFGFPLSKEGGNWSIATNMYKVGANTMKVLGSGDLSCTPNPSRTQLHIELPRDFSKLPGASVIINAPEKVNIRGTDFTLKTASPAWLAATLPITNKVNLVSFEAVFTSTSSAEGLLSVYWETNVVGSLDERVALTGIRQYTFPIPEIAISGTRTLGFRLDAFSAIQSSVTVTNVALGFAGVKEPFSLSFIGSDANRVPILQLNGPSGYHYSVESSLNLIDWKTIAILVNTNGTVRFVDPNTNNATARFYRAVAP